MILLLRLLPRCSSRVSCACRWISCNKRVLLLLLRLQVDKYVRGWDKPSDHAPVWVTIESGIKRKDIATGGGL